ncbi:MAG: hypothetical protein QMC80_03560 [Thermoplasmatales archaeon]|nr:hypothetical protein [Thermoplasmatales archaeon]
MQISGCGYVCSECFLKAGGACQSCSKESEVVENCEIISCLEKKGIEHCLKCADRYKNGAVCKTYKQGLRHCPLRIGVLTK